MSTNAWVVDLTGVLSNGVVTQLYPAWLAAGVNPATATNAQLLRKPDYGALHSIQVKSDGINAGTLEIYDMDGLLEGDDVSSATTITNANLVAALAAGRAKLIYKQDVPSTAGTGIVNAPGLYRAFSKGLAARYVSSGSCTLNCVVNGGYRVVESRGV